VSAKPISTDIRAIRERAREHMERGAVIEGYRADREAVVKLLNDALATELVCVLRYKRHYFTASGLRAEPAAAEFLEHARQEQEHADSLATRIVTLRRTTHRAPAHVRDRSVRVSLPSRRDVLNEGGTSQVSRRMAYQPRAAVRRAVFTACGVGSSGNMAPVVRPCPSIGSRRHSPCSQTPDRRSCSGSGYSRADD
jgi:hypothetical protein